MSRSSASPVRTRATVVLWCPQLLAQGQAHVCVGWHLPSLILLSSGTAGQERGLWGCPIPQRSRAPAALSQTTLSSAKEVGQLSPCPVSQGSRRFSRFAAHCPLPYYPGGIPRTSTLIQKKDPFSFRYFLNRLLHVCPEQPGAQSSYLLFPHSWNDECAQPCPAFHWLRWSLENFFFLDQAGLEL
jgi:hypothetical protein